MRTRLAWILASSSANQPTSAALAEVEASPALTLPESYAGLLEPRFDDLDAMLKRRTIRVLVVHSKLFYFLDRGQQRGLRYERCRCSRQISIAI